MALAVYGWRLNIDFARFLLGGFMFRRFMLSFLYFTCLASEGSQSRKLHAPWVSCFSENGNEFEGSKMVRTPSVTSLDGRLKAYAEISANGVPQPNCENTVRLFVSTSNGSDFRQVFMERPSLLAGTANSLGPIGWSPNGRWLLVEFGNWWYDADGGGLGVLLYDRQNNRVLMPDLPLLVRKSLKQDCSIELFEVLGFDASSHVLLRLADSYDEGDDQPQTHCFRGVEDWSVDPARGTIKRGLASR
jgi:hypothetical protein